jgi:hypothetical protein
MVQVVTARRSGSSWLRGGAHHGGCESRRLRRASRTVGFNIGLPDQQRPNAYITRGLSFEFHYFFMRKLWFAHLARARWSRSLEVSGHSTS